ncbi:site-specific integrase [Brevibacterium sp.]|uniref:site-specific integrase n=1 Tax=Brevibacterium sp. TaxID=1701 RepID=UPI002812244D|nr:site-specific integrase [Brevibacterium sp.]
MAKAVAYETDAGRRYMVRYRKPDGKQTKKRGFKTKREAEAWAATVEVSKQQGTFIPEELGRVKVGDLGSAWIRRQSDWKESYAYTMRSTWWAHVEPRWGKTAIADLNRVDVEDWVSTLGRSNSVASRCVTILNGILDDAVSQRLLPINRVGKVALPRKDPKARVYLTHQQVADFAAAAGERGVIIHVLAYTGLRWGELAGLHGPDIDTVGRRISVNRNAVQVGSKIVVGSPKTHELRTVPVPRFLATKLKDHIRPGIVFPDGKGGYARSPRASETKRSWWRTAVIDSKIPEVTPHDLRHTAASLAVQSGAHVKAVQRMLGHKSAAMTLDVYSDLFDSDLDIVADAMEAARLSALKQIVPNACPPGTIHT